MTEGTEAKPSARMETYPFADSDPLRRAAPALSLDGEGFMKQAFQVVCVSIVEDSSVCFSWSGSIREHSCHSWLKVL